jgi:hypothetical protein
MGCDKRSFIKGWGLFFLVFIPFLNACNRPSGEFQPREGKMQISPGAQTPSVPRKSIPPIDLAAPGRIETATFALG